MIEQLLPAGVASYAVLEDDPDGRLFPEEAAQIARAVPARRREFATGRMCARAALRQLGMAEVPILSGHRREPLWPAGVVGSITHCPGYRAAAVARTVDAMAIGIDAELHAALPQGVLERVSSPQERTWLRAAPESFCWDRLLFSAKESLYKAWFALTGRALQFEDATVHFQPTDGCFSTRLSVAPEVHGVHEFNALEGRFMVSAGLALTAVVVQGSRR
jgi:4'-phosphopantetheinyl transferase EntD